MAEQVTFKLTLQDLMSGALNKMRGTARSVFGDVDNRIGNVKRNLGDIGRQNPQIHIDTRGIDGAIQATRRLKKELNDIGGGSSGSGISFGRLAGAGFVANMATTAITGIASLIATTITDTLHFGIDMQRKEIGLGTFVGDQRASQIINRLFDKAPLTPFTTSQLLPVETGLIASGRKSPEVAEKAMLNLANAVSGSAGGDPFLFQLGGANLQKIASQGYMNTRELNEFQQVALIPIAEMLRRDYLPNMNPLKGTQKIKKAVEEGKVTFDMVADALDKAAQKGGMFYNAMYRISQTVGGKWSTIVDRWQQAQYSIFKASSPGITRLEDKLIEYITSLPAKVDEWAPKISDFIDRAVNWLENEAPTVMGNLMDVTGKVLNFLTSKEAMDIATGFVKLANGLTTVLLPAIDSVSYVVKTVTDIVNAMPHPRSENEQRHNLNPDQPTSGVFSYHALYDDKSFNETDAERDLDKMIKLNGGQRISLADTSAMGKDFMQRFPHLKGILYDIKATTPADVGNKPSTQGAGTGTGADNPDLSTKADRITGGGQKQIIININRSPFEIHDMKVTNGSGGMMGLDELKRRFEEWFLEILHSANVAIG